MLIYGYKGKKCPVSTNYWNCDKNLWALHYYNEDLFNNSQINKEIWLRQVYNSYTTLCKFNNFLVNVYEIDEDVLKNIDFINSYLQQNEDIKDNSVDSKCRSIYDNLNTWYKRLIANYNCLDEIKEQVIRSMKFYEKQEIFSIASINLKRNYYDFVV